MSTDEIDPKILDAKHETLDDDPLAELARIVAGENEQGAAQSVDVPVMDEPETSVEDQLSQELVADNPETESVDDFAASIQSQMEAHLSQDAPVQETVPEPGESETLEQASASVATDSNVEAEIELPDLEQVFDQDVKEIAAVAETQLQQAAIVEENEEVAFQDDLIEALQEEINPSEQIAEPEEVRPEIEEPVVMAATEDAPQFEAPNMPEPDQPEFDAGNAEQGTSEEIDFTSAFADELGMDTVEEVNGWNAEDEAQAADDFTLAAQPVLAQPVAGMETDAPEALDQVDPTHEEYAAIDAAENQKSGGGFKYAMAALVIALFAGAITAGYGFLGDGDETEVAENAAIIKADAEPVKVKPENPGGRVPDNQDKASYSKVGGVEEEVDQSTLLSNTEQPALIDTSNASQEAIEQAQSSLAATGGNAKKSDDRLTSSGDVENEILASNNNVEPKRVKTLVIKPDGTVVDKPSILQTTNTQQIETSSSALGLTAVPDATPRQVATTSVKPNEPIDGARSTQDIGVPKASPRPKPEPEAVQPVQQAAAPQPTPTPAPAAPSAVRSEWVVQVASQTSPEAAQASFQQMRQQYSALQNRSMSVQRAAVNGRTYYRVRVQTASRNDANQLCSQLTSQGGSCFVTR